MNKILLHSCCAPCSTSSSFDLRKKGFEPILFFYNPNIHPLNEYKKRVKEIEKWAQINNFNLIVGEYDKDRWFEMMRGLEQEPEGGKGDSGVTVPCHLRLGHPLLFHPHRPVI